MASAGVASPSAENITTNNRHYAEGTARRAH